MGSTSLKSWIEMLVAAGVAVLLAFFSIQISGYTLALAVLPLVYFALRRGIVQGMLASLLAGIIILVMQLGETELSVSLVTFFGPYAFIGLSGLFAKNTQRTLNNKRFKNAALNIVTAAIFGSLLFFIWQFIASGTLENEMIGFALTSAAVAIVLLLLAKVAPNLFVPKDTRFLSRKEKSRLLND